MSRYAPGTYTPDGRYPQTRYTMAARYYDGQMVARLRAGRSLAEAQAQLEVITRLLAIGCLLGCMCAWAARRTMEAILFGVPSFHVPTIVLTVTTVGIAILLASLLPAMRAARISPMEALRHE